MEKYSSISSIIERMKKQMLTDSTPFFHSALYADSLALMFGVRKETW